MLWVVVGLSLVAATPSPPSPCSTSDECPRDTSNKCFAPACIDNQCALVEVTFSPSNPCETVTCDPTTGLRTVVAFNFTCCTLDVNDHCETPIDPCLEAFCNVSDTATTQGQCGVRPVAGVDACPGACCTTPQLEQMLSDACTFVNASECAESGGTWQGSDTNCATGCNTPAPTPVPTPAPTVFPDCGCPIIMEGSRSIGNSSYVRDPENSQYTFAVTYAFPGGDACEGIVATLSNISVRSQMNPDVVGADVMCFVTNGQAVCDTSSANGFELTFANSTPVDITLLDVVFLDSPEITDGQLVVDYGVTLTNNGLTRECPLFTLESERVCECPTITVEPRATFYENDDLIRRFNVTVTDIGPDECVNETNTLLITATDVTTASLGQFPFIRTEPPQPIVMTGPETVALTVQNGEPVTVFTYYDPVLENNEFVFDYDNQVGFPRTKCSSVFFFTPPELTLTSLFCACPDISDPNVVDQECSDTNPSCRDVTFKVSISQSLQPQDCIPCTIPLQDTDLGCNDMTVPIRYTLENVSTSNSNKRLLVRNGGNVLFQPQEEVGGIFPSQDFLITVFLTDNQITFRFGLDDVASGCVSQRDTDLAAAVCPVDQDSLCVDTCLLLPESVICAPRTEQSCKNECFYDDVNEVCETCPACTLPPTPAPSTSMPTSVPTSVPTSNPTQMPTAVPTPMPTPATCPCPKETEVGFLDSSTSGGITTSRVRLEMSFDVPVPPNMFCDYTVVAKNADRVTRVVTDNLVELFPFAFDVTVRPDPTGSLLVLIYEIDLINIDQFVIPEPLSITVDSRRQPQQQCEQRLFQVTEKSVVQTSSASEGLASLPVLSPDYLLYAYNLCHVLTNCGFAHEAACQVGDQESCFANHCCTRQF